MRHIQEWFWSEENKKHCGSLVVGGCKASYQWEVRKGTAVQDDMGGGPSYWPEASRVSKCWSLVWGLPCDGSSVR